MQHDLGKGNAAAVENPKFFPLAEFIVLIFKGIEFAGTDHAVLLPARQVVHMPVHTMIENIRQHFRRGNDGLALQKSLQV